MYSGSAWLTVTVIFAVAVLYSSSSGVNVTSYSVTSLSETEGFVSATVHVNVPDTSPFLLVTFPLVIALSPRDWP